jgi:hypothetical protein
MIVTIWVVCGLILESGIVGFTCIFRAVIWVVIACNLIFMYQLFYLLLQGASCSLNIEIWGLSYMVPMYQTFSQASSMCNVNMKKVVFHPKSYTSMLDQTQRIMKECASFYFVEYKKQMLLWNFIFIKLHFLELIDLMTLRFVCNAWVNTNFNFHSNHININLA